MVNSLRGRGQTYIKYYITEEIRIDCTTYTDSIVWCVGAVVVRTYAVGVCTHRWIANAYQYIEGNLYRYTHRHRTTTHRGQC